MNVGPITSAGRTRRAPTSLGALPDDESAGFEAHLDDCPACRAEVDELRVAAEALPVSRAGDAPAARAEGADHGRGGARGGAAGLREPAADAGPAPRAPVLAGGFVLPLARGGRAGLRGAARRPRRGRARSSAAARAAAHDPVQDRRSAARRRRRSWRSTATSRAGGQRPAARRPAASVYMVWLQRDGPGARADVGAVHAAPRRLGDRGQRGRREGSSR